MSDSELFTFIEITPGKLAGILLVGFVLGVLIGVPLDWVVLRYVLRCG